MQRIFSRRRNPVSVVPESALATKLHSNNVLTFLKPSDRCVTLYSVLVRVPSSLLSLGFHLFTCHCAAFSVVSAPAAAAAAMMLSLCLTDQQPSLVFYWSIFLRCHTSANNRVFLRWQTWWCHTQIELSAWVLCESCVYFVWREEAPVELLLARGNSTGGFPLFAVI